MIHRPNRLYKAHRKTGIPQLREKYISLRHSIRSKLKESHEAYLDEIIGLEHRKDASPGQVNSKKLFQYLKDSGTDQQSIPPLKRNEQLCTKTKERLIF